MNHAIDTLLITRKNILALIEGMSLEKLNTIPSGFNNNLAWNLGHLVVTQQLLVYKLSNTPMYIPNEIVDNYKKGSQPTTDINAEELQQLKDWLLLLPEKMRVDYQENHFTNYNSYTTSYNITLHTAEEAIVFNNVHEGLHFGYMMAMKRILNNL